MTVKSALFALLLLACRVLSYNPRLVALLFLNILVSGKKLCELMLPLSTRIADVQHFLKDIKPDLEQNVVPITDPFGPTIVEPNLHCLVVSEETKTGGETINAKRLERVCSHCATAVILSLQVILGVL